MLTKDQIRAIFMANGFEIKAGHSDLKPYVYAAAEALLSASKPAAPAQSGEALTRELLEALQMMVKQFTQTPSTLTDSKTRVKAHEVIAKAHAQLGCTAPQPTQPAKAGEPTVAWMTLDCVHLKPCDVHLDKSEVEGMRPEHVVELIRRPQSAVVLDGERAANNDAVTREQIKAWAKLAGIPTMFEKHIEQLGDFAIFARQARAASPQIKA